MILPFHTSNDALLETLVPFVVATPMSRAELDLAPFGLNIAQVINPLHLDSEPFLARLQRLDALGFGPEGLPMPRWVFFDCAELPSAIFGFARPIEEASSHVRTLFELEAGATGYIPYAMYAALPMFHAGHWFGHNLCTLAQSSDATDDPPLRGLGSITKALGLQVLGVTRLFGATQWASRSLFVHSKFGPMELKTAYTPAHTEPETLTYVFDVTEDTIRAAMGDRTVVLPRPEPTEWLDSDDVEGMMRLQDRIESGARYVITGPPLREGERNRVPLARMG
jgi:hypothetical protein